MRNSPFPIPHHNMELPLPYIISGIIHGLSSFSMFPYGDHSPISVTTTYQPYVAFIGNYNNSPWALFIMPCCSNCFDNSSYVQLDLSWNSYELTILQLIPFQLHMEYFQGPLYVLGPHSTMILTFLSHRHIFHNFEPHNIFIDGNIPFLD